MFKYLVDVQMFGDICSIFNSLSKNVQCTSPKNTRENYLELHIFHSKNIPILLLFLKICSLAANAQ